MSEWKEYKIGKFIDLINGYAFKSTDFLEQQVENSLPVIKIKNVANGDTNLNNVVFHLYNKTLEKVLLKKGDVLIAMTGNHPHAMTQVVGDVSMYRLDENSLMNQRVGKLVAKNDTSIVFIYYLLKEKNVQNYLSNKASGSANQANISKGDILGLKLKIPEPKEQQQIASILSAYDELIENNNRRVAILEQTAEQIYKEWFVRMRFPGYENTEFEKGVPKGWEWKKVEEIFKTSSGGTPSRQKEQEYFGGNIDWIKTGELKDSYIFDSEEKITDAGLQNSSAKLFPPDSLLMAMYGVNIGQLGISVKPSTANQAVCVFSPKAPKEYSLYYSYFYFKSIRSHLFNISMGAAQQNLSQEIIKRLNFLKPEKNLLSSFNKIQKPIFELLLKLSLQNQNLKQTRDLLLPRLISGKLKVKEAEKEID